VYIAITKDRKTENGTAISGTIYNLSATPIELNAKQFLLFDKNGDSVSASSGSNFDKVTLDIKAESPFTLQFPKLSGSPKKLAFADGNKTSEKWYP
jgi:hypothetical protein